MLFASLLLFSAAFGPQTASGQYTINDIVKGVTEKTGKKSSKKQPKKSGPIGRAWQDMTSRYNRYFNAKLRYTEGIQQLTVGKKDNYDELLPVYAYKGGDGSAITTNLDEVIKKTSINIQKKPNSKWVDDSYLLLGQANYLKGDYSEAAESFQYIISNFSYNKRKSYDKRSSAGIKKLKDQERQELKKEKEKEREEKAKLAAEEREQREKEREEAAKKREEERDAKREAYEKERKEKEKERKETAKEKEKERKETAKQREKERKEKAKQREKERKEREKNRKKGIKTPPKTNTPTTPEPPNEETSKSKKEKEEPAAKDKTKEKKPKEEPAKPSEKEKELEKARQATADSLKNAEKEAQNAAEEADNGLETVKSINGIEKEYKGGGLFGFMKHKLSKYQAMIWLGRTYIENNKPDDALSVIKAIENDKKFPKKLRGEFQTMYVNYHINNESWQEARTMLQEAVKHVSKKNGRARLHYVLAQLETDAENYAEAAKQFDKVIHSRPSFEMEFNAYFNKIQTKLKSGQYTPAKAIAELEKMTKETKYADYTDKLFLAMAEIAEESGQTDLAAAYLDKATQKGGKNPEQKAIAYLKKANNNYDQEKYETAAPLYDSCIVSLPKKHKEYKRAKTRSEVLGDLVRNLKIVDLQDSLKHIANLPPKERDRYIDQIIAQLELEARNKQEQQFLEDSQANAGNEGETASGTWYFYNETQRSNGFNQFASRWGSRPLVDNWRLSSRLAGAGGSVANTDSTDNIANNKNNLLELAQSSILTREAIIAMLPLTAAKMAKADSMIIEALYASANIYRNSLENDEKSIVIFEDLLHRYPSTPYDAQIHYALYMLYTKQGKTNKALPHQNHILQIYPNSIYARMIKDPEYAAKMAKIGSEIEQYYDATFALYKQQNYSQVLQRAQAADSLFSENPLKPKFALLSAFAVGNIQDKNAYVNALKDIILKYPTDEVKTKAQEILSYLEASDVKAANDSVNAATAAAYKLDAAAKHYVLVAPEGGLSQKISQLSNKISDFNTTNFSSDGLKHNQMLLDPEHQIILIKEFSNASKAMLYYSALKQNMPTIMTGMDKPIISFVISKPNFTQLFKDKNIAAYLQFFNENYKQE